VHELRGAFFRHKVFYILAITLSVIITFTFAGIHLKRVSNVSRKTLDSQITVIPTAKNSGSSMVAIANKGKNIEVNSYSMNLPPMHQGLSKSLSPELRKLAEYEEVSGGAVASAMMIFINTPDDETTAQQNAVYLTSELLEFAKFDITPVVIMEPTTDSGPLDYKTYRNGSYDNALNALFGNLKKSRITDEDMGIWVPFPEDNAPLWGNTDPTDFSANVTRTIQIQKQHFPSSRASILLNSQTYSSADTDWAYGKYSSLVPYVQGIPPGLVESFGMQGFPWAPVHGSNATPILSAATYLPVSLAKEAAQQLGVKRIWFNTGTFSAKYTSNNHQTIHIGADQRALTLDSVILQTNALQKQGYQLTINLFSADKSSLEEATDWSYWNNLGTNNPDKGVFINFVKSVYRSNIGLWLFDSFDP
jgi:hypothetical protein